MSFHLCVAIGPSHFFTHVRFVFVRLFFFGAAVNKQLADKERVAAALENENLLGVVQKCIANTDPDPEQP